MADPSDAKKHVLLITGAPGVGKTTVIRRVAAGLSGKAIRGFTTEEMREDGERVGFRLETFEGKSMTLAHVNIRSPHRVSRYGVDIMALESIVESALGPGEGADVHLIDEIGKMECSSSRFVAAVERLLDSGSPVVATVALRGGGLIERVKGRPDAELWKVTRENRESLPQKALSWIETVRGSRGARRAKR